MADDISFKATLDDTQVVSSAARMEGAVKKASSSIQAEFQRVYVSQQKISQGASGSSYRIGQVALQAQDVAVQLQGGAKAAQVIAQQGSQIASIFGPTGMIIGGVLAIGSGLLGWATAEEKAIQKAKEFEEQQRKIQDLSDRASNQMFSTHEEVVGLDARVRGGDMLEREVKLDRARNKELKETEELMFDLWKAGNDLGDETRFWLQDQVEAKYALQSVLAISERIGKVMGTIADGEHAAAQAAGAEIAMQKQFVTLEEQHLKKFEEREAAGEKMEKDAKQLLEHAKGLAALATKGLHGLFDQYGLEAQTKELAKQALLAKSIMGQRIVDAANALLDPAGAKAERNKQKAENKADRTIAEREANAIDARRRNAGLDPMSREQRAAEIAKRRQAAHDIRHPKTTIKIDPADIQSLATAMMAAAAAQNAK